MQYSRFVALVAAVLSYGNSVLGAPTKGSASSSSTSNSTSHNYTAYSGEAECQNAHADGRLFNINGKTQRFAGTNTWWLGYLTKDADVDAVLSEIANTKYLTTRVWGFGNVNDPSAANGGIYYQTLNQNLPGGQAINYDPHTGIPRLDAVVSAAEKHNIKLIIPFLNNWDDLGGINTYTTAFGGTHTSFYTDAASQQAYRNYISFIVNRYKSSPAIFAWELCNEPRCPGCATSVITNWASETSAFIKGLDADHMVALGDEGWLVPPAGDGSYAYSGYEGVDFAKNLAISTLDYGTFHIYPDQWGYPSSFGPQWIQDHDAVSKAVGKPIVLEEYGWYGAGNRTDVLEGWQATMLSCGLASDSIWQFATTSAGAADKYSVYYGTPEYQVLGNEHACNMLAT